MRQHISRSRRSIARWWWWWEMFQFDSTFNFLLFSFLLQFMLLKDSNPNGLMDHQVIQMPRFSSIILAIFFFILSLFLCFCSLMMLQPLLQSFHYIYESITDHKNYWNEMNGNRWLCCFLIVLFLQLQTIVRQIGFSIRDSSTCRLRWGKFDEELP